MGGLSKKSSLLTKLTATGDSLKVDAGSLFFDNKVASQPQRLPQALITAAAIVEAYNHMGYDGLAIGRQDLAAGLEALQSLATKASFPFLSANLVDHKDALLFKGVTHVQRAGMRISLIGLTGQTPTPEACADTIKILPWQDVLPQTIAQISPHSDFIVILSNLSAAENREIAEQMANVHLILQSGVSKQNMRPLLINNTLITQAGHDGKYQGQLTVHWTAAQQWQEQERPQLALQKEYDRLGWFINRVRKKGGADVVYKNNEAGRQAYKQKLKRYQVLEQELKSLAASEETKAIAPATYNNRFHPLPPSVPDDPTILKLLQGARKKANQLRRQRVETKSLEQFLGSNSCRSCHEATYKAWSTTPHASAYQTLREREQNNNQTCVYCHVTGLAENNAHLATHLPDALKAVGCEVCHGPGQLHAAKPHLNPPPLTPTASLCTGCHTPERDDNFAFQQDKLKVH